MKIVSDDLNILRIFAFCKFIVYICNIMVSRINLILQAKNITARQFADEIGVQPSGVSHILSGRNNPSLDFVMKVIKRYPEININWLMFGSGEMMVSDVLSTKTTLQSSNVATQPVREEVDREMYAQIDGNKSIVSAGGESGRPTDNFKDVVNRTQIEKSDNLTLFDTEEPTLFSDYASSKPLEKLSVSEASSYYSLQDQSPKKAPARSFSSQEKSDEETKKNDVSPTYAVLDENTTNQFVTTCHKRIVKMVILYDDHTFAEYFPE